MKGKKTRYEVSSAWVTWLPYLTVVLMRFLLPLLSSFETAAGRIALGLVCVAISLLQPGRHVVQGQGCRV